MRVSLSWLSEYVDVTLAPEALAEKLDMSGTKVEAILRPGEGVSGVLVAEVAQIEPHPNADTLLLVEASVGDGDVRRIVCGAHNFEVGDRVPLAVPGAKLPGGIEIGERKLRGQLSQGMLCSGSELGISKDHSGILVLPSDAEIGGDVGEVLGLDDTILELELTPNRPDCMAMVGIAREVAALTGKELRTPDPSFKGLEIDPKVEVDIEDPVGCPRYVARALENITIGASPQWLTRRLLAAGVRPISNVVDVTNYVMLESGQPLHAFDGSLIDQRTIVVRRARPNEPLTTLDGIERRMSPEDLLITDPRRPLAIAGVMGGEDSEVAATTTSVILESAYFDAATVALSSRRHALRTEASARFERGADPNGALAAADRAAQLMVDLAGAEAAREAVDRYPTPVERQTVRLRPARTERILGITVDTEDQVQVLRDLGMDVAEVGGAIEAKVPTFRPDVTREIDLIEEVARVHGYDKLPATIPPGGAGGLTPAQAGERRVRRILTGLGLHEAWTPSFASDAELDLMGLAGDHPARRSVALANPVSDEATAMRTTLIPGLLRSAARNFAHHAPGVALFEIARVYVPSESALPNEGLVLGAVVAGERTPDTWLGPPRLWGFFEAKGIVQTLAASLSVTEVDAEPSQGMPFHPTRGAVLSFEGHRMGMLGELHPDVCAAFDVPEGTVAFELSLPALLERSGRPAIEELPRYPSIYIDLAVVVDEDTPAARIAEAILESGAPEMTSMRLFDVYRGPQIGTGKKSLAYALELRDASRTLTDDDAEAVRDRIVQRLKAAVGGELRT